MNSVNAFVILLIVGTIATCALGKHHKGLGDQAPPPSPPPPAPQRSQTLPLERPARAPRGGGGGKGGVGGAAGALGAAGLGARLGSSALPAVHSGIENAFCNGGSCTQKLLGKLGG